MAENNFMRFIPPNLRGPLTDLGIFGRVAADNIIGLDDDFESTGETLGTAFREDPVGLAKDLGTGIYEGAKSIYDDPEGAYDSFTTGLGETFDRLNTPYDQLDLSTEEAQRERAGDIAIFGEALGAGGVLTKGLTSLAKKQLKQKVIEEKPGLNEDQVNSIVEGTDYDPTEAMNDLYTDIGRPDRGIDFDALDQVDDFSEIDPQVIVGETGYNPRDRYEVDDVEYEEIDLDTFIGDPTSEIDQAYNRGELVPIVTAGDAVIGTANPNRVEDLDVDGNLYGPPDTFDEMNPPEIEDLMEPLDQVADDDLIPGLDEEEIIRRQNEADAVGMDPPEDDAGLLEMREAIEVDEDELRIRRENEADAVGFADDELNYNPDAYVVEVRNSVQQYLDDNNISLVDARERLSRNQLGDSFPRDIAAFVGDQGITTPGYLTLSSALSQLEASVTPFGLNAEDMPDDLYDRLRDIALEEPITEQQANDVRNLVTQTLNIDANTDMDVGGGAFDDTVDQINQVLDGQPLNFTNQQGQVNAWLTAPGYERFAPDPTDDSPDFSTDAELEAGDIGLTSKNSYLTSRMDKAITDLSQKQTKFASMEQLVNTLMNKYGVQLTELQARNIPTDKIEADLREGYSAQMFSGDKIDLKELIANRQLEDPFVVRTLGGRDVAYATNFTKGVTNYKETLIGLRFPEIYNAGVMDPDHFMRHQEKMGGPTVVHIRTGEFPVALTADEMAGTTRQKSFHLGEIQSQVERVHRDSRRSRNMILAFEDKVLNAAEVGRFETDKIAEDSVKRMKLFRDVERLISNGAARDDAAPGMKRMLDKADNELGELNASYDLYDSDTGELVRPGGQVLSSFENEFRDMLADTKIELFGKFKRGDNFATPDLMQKVLDYANETNIDDVGVGSIFQTDRITRMGIKEALQQAVDTDAEFFTLGTGQMAKNMTYGKEKGQKEYYDTIVPKTFNKIMAQIEKQNGVELPRLEKRKIETLTQDGDNVIEQEVLGIELTDELREVFKSGKVEAFRKGGLVTLAKEVL